MFLISFSFSFSFTQEIARLGFKKKEAFWLTIRLSCCNFAFFPGLLLVRLWRILSLEHETSAWTTEGSLLQSRTSRQAMKRSSHFPLDGISGVRHCSWPNFTPCADSYVTLFRDAVKLAGLSRSWIKVWNRILNHFEFAHFNGTISRSLQDQQHLEITVLCMAYRAEVCLQVLRGHPRFKKSSSLALV